VVHPEEVRPLAVQHAVDPEVDLAVAAQQQQEVLAESASGKVTAHTAIDQG